MVIYEAHIVAILPYKAKVEKEFLKIRLKLNFCLVSVGCH